jgi:hypothetical protein
MYRNHHKLLAVVLAVLLAGPVFAQIIPGTGAQQNASPRRRTK